jgi:hypothetical protein
LEGIDKSGWYGMVLLTRSFAVKCVKMCNEPISMEGTATVIAEGGAAPAELPVLNSEETLEPVTTDPVAAPAVKGNLIQQESVQGYSCLPWRVEAVDSRGPSWDNELSNYMAADACGISPAFHGSCIIHHGEKQLYGRLKNCTGLFLNAPWLRNLICTQLRNLHGSSPHTHNPVGCLLMTRVPYTLASYDGDPRGLDANELEKQLQGLHWCAIAHGLVHADYRPSNLGLTEQHHIKLLDWGGSTSSVCFEKLPKAAADAVLLCLQQLTQGVIDEAIAKLGHKARRATADKEPNRSWWPFV